MRTYAPSPQVPAPSFPLYAYPRHLGDEAQAVSAAGPVAGSVATGIAASSATPAIAAAAGPIGAAVAAAIAIIGSLLAAHEKRMQDAKTENARVGAAVPSFYGVVQQVVSSLNAGQIAPQDAISALQQLDQVTLQQFRQFVGTPGTAWNSSSPGVCDKSCTVACCIYNTWLHPDLYGASGKQGVIPVIQAGGGTLNIGGIPSNQYGLAPFAKQTITIAPPAAGTLTSGVASLFGSGGASSWLPWIALGFGGYLLLSSFAGGNQ
jgi:hypothetical protein